MSNIGILTWHYYPNHGGMLQAYALQTILQDLGNNVLIVDYRTSHFTPPIQR